MNRIRRIYTFLRDLIKALRGGYEVPPSETPPAQTDKPWISGEHVSAEGLDIPYRSPAEIALANEYFGVPVQATPELGSEINHYLWQENIGECAGLEDSPRQFDEADKFEVYPPGADEDAPRHTTTFEEPKT